MVVGRPEAFYNSVVDQISKNPSEQFDRRNARQLHNRRRNSKLHGRFLGLNSTSTVGTIEKINEGFPFGMLDHFAKTTTLPIELI